MTAAQLTALLEEQRGIMEVLAQKVARPTESALLKTQARIVQSLARFEGTVDTASRTAALNTARRIVADAGLEAAQRMKDDAPGIIKAGAMRTRELTELLVPRGDRLDAIVSTFMSFEKSIEEKRAFALGSVKLQAFMDKYTVDWESGWSGTIKGLQAKFTQGAVSSLDWRVISRTIVNESGALVVPGGMDAETFATMFARTKVTEIDNLTARAMGDEAGLELYVNLGVPDDNQSEDCYDATNAGAMTMTDWADSAYDEPPRHPNCRCMLFPVPFDPEISVDNNKYDVERPLEAVA